MRPSDLPLMKSLIEKLREFDRSSNLPGVRSPAAINTLAMQMIDSVRRIRYVTTIAAKKCDIVYIDPYSLYFDPFRAAAWFNQNGHTEDSFWMIFLGTHFGKNRRSGWNLLREVYKGNKKLGPWTWASINSNFDAFRRWLEADYKRIKSSGSFGNHRKYQSLDPYSQTGTGVAIGSYLEWIKSAGDHTTLFNDALSKFSGDSRASFNFLYNSMNQVMTFGRTAKFDYLTMVGKFDLAPIQPGLTYMNGATGPKRGARLLFGGSVNSPIDDKELNDLLSKLDAHLDLYFGMQVLEDSLCNWQKSSEQYVHFVG